MSYKWKHTICSFLFWLISLTIMLVRFIHIVNYLLLLSHLTYEETKCQADLMIHSGLYVEAGFKHSQPDSSTCALTHLSIPLHLGSGPLALVTTHRLVLAKCFTCLSFPPLYNHNASCTHGPPDVAQRTWAAASSSSFFFFFSFLGLSRKCSHIKLQQNTLVKKNALFTWFLRRCLWSLPSESVNPSP